MSESYHLSQLYSEAILYSVYRCLNRFQFSARLPVRSNAGGCDRWGRCAILVFKIVLLLISIIYLCQVHAPIYEACNS